MNRIKLPTPTRWSLLARLKNWEDQTSRREFFDAYWRLIYSVASFPLDFLPGNPIMLFESAANRARQADIS